MFRDLHVTVPPRDQVRVAQKSSVHIKILLIQLSTYIHITSVLLTFCSMQMALPWAMQYQNCPSVSGGPGLFYLNLDCLAGS